MSAREELRDYQLRLLPRHRILLCMLNGNGPRFVRLFREAWRRLPLAVRRQILKHWRNREPEGKLPGERYRWTPKIELISGTSDFRRGSSGDAAAQCVFMGEALAFDAESMDSWPEWVVQIVVAHELGHVYQWAVRSAEIRRADAAHSELRTLMTEWGFDVDAYDEWFNSSV